jgi:hypothetical protein
MAKAASAGEKAVAKYLARSAEPESALAGKFGGDFGDVLVMPACTEKSRPSSRRWARSRAASAETPWLSSS